MPDRLDEEHFLPLLDFVYSSLREGKYAEVLIYFNFFKNVVVQLPTSIYFFPLDFRTFEDINKELDLHIEEKPKHREFLIEPGAKELIKELQRQFRNYLFFTAILQNKTGEFASRMLAMKNAKDNSSEMIKKLTLIFNKERQAKITQEVSEIVSAKEAIETAGA